MSKQKFVGSGDLAIRPEAVGLTWPRAPGDSEYDSSATRNGVAVIKICGPLEHHGGWWFESYEKILGRVEGAMLDEDVRSILLDIDSPGGEVSGLQETVRRIRSLSEEHGKKIVAYADDEAYSAAYALACAAEEIYIPESGGVGSIGVLAEVVNLLGAVEKQGIKVEVIRSGARKADGHPFIPLDDATIARIQTRVNDLARQFFALVAESRPVARKDIESLQGACVYGARAVKAGLADGVASFDDVFSALSEESIDNLPSSAVSFNPNDRSDSDGPGASAMFKVLEKKVASTLAALTAATGAAAKKRAADAYAKAVAALTEAKVKKTYNKKTVEEESEEDDGEDDEDESAAEDSEDESEAAAAEEDESSDEDEKKAKKSKKASAGSLASFVKSLTGQSSESAAKQVLESMHEQAQLAAQASERIAKLEAAASAAKRSALVTEMMSAGQIKPAQREWAEGQSIKSLRAFQKATPAMFAPRPAPVHEEHASAESPDTDGLTAFERKLCTEQGITAESYKKARDAGGAASNIPKVN